MVLVATIATLRIALHQPDQIATTTTRSRRGPGPDPGTEPPAGAVAPGRPEESAGWLADRINRSASPGRGGAPMPAGFQWMDAAPAPKVRSGFALVVILAFLGALLAMAVAALVAGISVALQGI